MDSEIGKTRGAYWEGAAQLFDGLSARSREARARIGPDGLVLADGELAGSYRAGDIELLEDEAGGCFRFALKAHPGWVVAFHGAEPLEWMRSAGLLRRPFLWGLPAGRKAVVLLALLAALAAFLYFVALDLAVEGVVRVLPRQVDRMLGESAAAAFAGDTAAPADSAAIRALAKSRAFVADLGTAEGDSARILVVRDSAMKNAYAFPGGSIVVYTGMLRLLETQEEWMALLAHEGAHVHLRHGMRGVVRGSLLALGASVVFGDLSGASSVLAENAGNLANLSFGRSQEAAADRFARDRLLALGYSAEGLETLFRKLLALQALPEWAAFLSTHPSTEARLEALGDVRGGPRRPLLAPEEWDALRGM